MQAVGCTDYCHWSPELHIFPYFACLPQ